MFKNEDETKLYGVIVGYHNISFVIDGFQCVFINAELDECHPTVVSSNNGFILGKTTKMQYVYIYVGKDIEIQNQLTLNIWLYFISLDPKLEKYEIISFKGGILDKLFFKSAMSFNPEIMDNMGTKVTYRDDRLTFPLQNEKIKGKLVIGSNVRESLSAENGNSVSNSETSLEIFFEEEKGIQTFSEMFNYVFSMCRFMVFRHNIRFKRILLKRRSERISGISEEIAECFINYDETAETKKEIFRCITFNTLQGSICGLLDSIVNNTQKKPQFNIGFIPDNDKDVNMFSSMKVREVCSALESELELGRIKADQDQEFQALVDELKLIVKEHREGERRLDKKSYDYIFGTLDHLTNALAKRIEKCFIQYQPLIGESLTQKEIDAIVNYRNIITHGNYMMLNVELAETTFVLMKLVYCCVLKRIGLEDNVIKELFEKKIIS